MSTKQACCWNGKKENRMLPNYNDILVATDLSQSSVNAFKHAVMMARRNKARIVITSYSIHYTKLYDHILLCEFQDNKHRHAGAIYTT